VDFGDELRLLGFDVLDDPRRAETSVRLYWQALKPLERHLRLYPFFVNAQGEMVENTEQRPLLTQLWYPPRLWSPGDIVVAETMPWPVGERWSLAVGVLAGSNWADWSQRVPIQNIETEQPVRRFEANTWVRLNTFERQGRSLVEIVPTDEDLQPAQPVQAIFATPNLAEQMELRGYDVVQEDQNLNVTLYWQALAPMPVDYTVFVHLLGPDGQLVVQHDDGPWWEVAIPTSTWQPGEKLRDMHALALPTGLPSGEYRLQTGVYYWETLERLAVLENGAPVNNFVELGSVKLK
jgi:hypothetical protein